MCCNKCLVKIKELLAKNIPTSAKHVVPYDEIDSSFLEINMKSVFNSVEQCVKCTIPVLLSNEFHNSFTQHFSDSLACRNHVK